MIKDNNLNDEIKEYLEKLQEKYNLTGQSLRDNLEGLLHGRYLKYWDYVHLDTLLSLQNPRTSFSDEMIFITYHQITELYFKLVLSEIQQIADEENPSLSFLLDKMGRLNRYFRHLTDSFDIMIDGMDVKAFRQFRTSLLPASGFQSAQYRKIEICSTDLTQLLDIQYQNTFPEEAGISARIPYLYWKRGATDEKTGKETITATYFQEKYGQEFLQLAQEYQSKNLWQVYQKLPTALQVDELKNVFREYDAWVNVNWKLAHYKSAIRYLKGDQVAIEATGGTNWQKYLPPRFQKRIFFPDLWTAEEKENWGKSWVESL